MKRIKIRSITAVMMLVMLITVIFSGTTKVLAATEEAFKGALDSALSSVNDADDSKKTIENRRKVLEAAYNAADEKEKTSKTARFGGEVNMYETTLTYKVDEGSADPETYTFNIGSEPDDSFDRAIAAIDAKAGDIVAGKDTSVDDAKDKLSSMKDSFNISADIEKGAKSLEGTEAFIETLLGIICYIAIIAMAVFTAFDVCYITMPVFKSKCDDKAMRGGVGTRNSSGGGPGGGEGRKLVVITDDAIQSVELAAETGKGPLGIYLKKRIASYVGIAIVLYMLLSGNISLIVDLAVKAVSGLLEQVNELT